MTKQCTCAFYSFFSSGAARLLLQARREAATYQDGRSVFRREGVSPGEEECKAWSPVGETPRGSGDGSSIAASVAAEHAEVSSALVCLAIACDLVRVERDEMCIFDEVVMAVCWGDGARYGPPPSYPRLRVPGLNAPIPAGASYGYQPGGWGRPPVDESGKLLFQAPEEEPGEEDEAQQAGGTVAEMWGELPPDAEVQVEEEEEGEQDSRGCLLTRR